MKKFCTTAFWMGTLASFILSLSLNAAVSQEQLKRRMVNDLEFIKDIFEVKYAPKKWKEEFADWDLDVEVESAKAKIASLENPTIKDFHIILKEFFNSAKDYHVNVRYFSTEKATLPFVVKGVGEKYYIVYIDRSKLPKWKFPVEVGDEITSFDYQPVATVLEKLRQSELGSNTLETDRALAELMLTTRRGDVGNVIPQGFVTFSVKNKVGKEVSYKMQWDYTPEKIKDAAKLGSKMTVQTSAYELEQEPKEILRASELFNKLMIHPQWNISSESRPMDDEPENNYIVGTRKSYIPALGKKVWQTRSDNSFDAYIYTNEEGKKIGYVRIPHYMADEDEAEEFRELIELFNKQTEALVIDQINNPGGSVFYVYAIASMLTDKPLVTPKHRMAITQEEVYTAVSLLPILELIKDEATAKMVFGETLGGYPMSYEVIRLMTGFCQFIISEWNEGNLYTKPSYILGVDEINPHPKTRYTKPILVIVNSLDFSAGDFFPAILQDNNRAKIFGSRTAGAGGYVLATRYPNQLGIKGFHMTGSIAERINKKPIENLGVTPDIHYRLSERDFQENYLEYVGAINASVNSLLSNQMGPS